MIKVASYCRVSTDKDDQVNSYEAQQSYFRDYIASNPNWKLYEIYADDGISGTSIKKRTEFNRMIHDAYAGRFQLILTKEVSRFSRNVVDTLRITRDLKRMGIAVVFVTDNINTLDGDGELRLTIMATIAQEESRRTSSRVVWGQTRRMEKGIVFGVSMLGYDVEDGRLTIEPNGAETVRLIFQKYALEQVGTSEIARFLTREGYRTYRGSKKWSAASIIKILKNEKYVGDLIQRKTYTPDYLTHEKRTNKGNVPLIVLKNHHEPIISREIWEISQHRLMKNNKHRREYTGHSNRYVFSGKIKCSQCGASFVGRIRTLKDGTKVRRWSCGTVVGKGTESCNIGKLVRDDDAMNMLRIALRNLPIDRESIIRSITDLVQADQSSTRDTPERLQFEIDRIQKKKESAMDLYLSGDISREDMITMKKRYEIQAESFRERLQNLEGAILDMSQKKDTIQEETAALLSGKTESEVLSKSILDHLTVFQDKHMELTFQHLPMVFYFQ